MGASVFYESASELVTLKNTFSVSGTPTDPAEVELTVKSPTGTSTTYRYSLSEISKISTGVYQKDIACSVAGQWEYTWVGTVTASDVVSGTWNVFPLQLGKLYCSPETLKSRLGTTGSTRDDYELHLACFTASRAIEDYCGRVFYRSPSSTVRTFNSTGMYQLAMPAFNDIVSVSTLKTDPSGNGSYSVTWDSTDYQLLWKGSANPTAFPEVRPYDCVKAIGTKTFPSGYWGVLARADRVQITGVFGWPAVPWAITQAAIVLAQDFHDLKDKGGPGGGPGGYGDFGRMRARKNPHVVNLCEHYARYENQWPVAKH